MLFRVDEISPHCSTNVNPRALVRRLNAEDEEQFIKLFRAVYGDTYSYNLLYEPGGFSSLIDSEQLISYGEFDSTNKLLAHTGFWHKEKESDFVESGCSFRLSRRTSNIKTSTIQTAWHEAFQSLSSNYDFIHQHCSTLHVLAQRYASHFMNAKSCGLIVEYAQEEQVKGIGHCSDNMHALIMTTVLHPDSFAPKEVYVPELFKNWIEIIYQNLTIPRTVYGMKTVRQTNTAPKISLAALESNPYISLQRRKLIKEQVCNENIKISSKRTDLIHVPLNCPELSSVIPQLFALGYYPCGVRPHVEQADELILQRLSGKYSLISNLLDHMKIANINTKEWIAQWQKLVLQIM